MPSFLRIPLVLSACALAACASTSPRVTSAPATEMRTQPVSPLLSRADDDYIARINRDARRRGLQVQWINPPQRRTD